MLNINTGGKQREADIIQPDDLGSRFIFQPACFTRKQCLPTLPSEPPVCYLQTMGGGGTVRGRLLYWTHAQEEPRWHGGGVFYFKTRAVETKMGTMEVCLLPWEKDQIE